MDITLFCENSQDDNQNVKNKLDDKVILSINKNKINEYLKIVTRLYDDKKIDNSDRTFLIKYIQVGGTIINVGKLVKIVNKVDDDELINFCFTTFDKFFTKEENILVKEINVKRKLEYVKKIDDIIKCVINDNDAIKFTNDQMNAINKVINFISNDDTRVFGFYGYAGTGKTTTLVELISYLLIKGYIKSIGLTAPTNKAVNIMKSKMRSNLKIIYEKYTGKRCSNDMNIDELLEQLCEVGVKIDFLTTHRLLNYKNDFNTEGERIFLKSGKSLIDEYNLVVIDECSMIPLQIIIHIFEEICRTDTNKKIIFSGDEPQLNPINEKKSAIFITNKDNLDYTSFTKTVQEMDKVTIVKKMDNFISTKARYDQLTKEIIGMECITLKEVMRNKIGNIVRLCYNIREWVDDIIKAPQLERFKGHGVYFYQCKPNQSKIESEWFKTFIKYQESMINNNVSNIILTWTNDQMNTYNNEIRKIMFGNVYNNQKLDRFEIGDILMLGDFYNFDENVVKGQDNKNRFYTSEQIKVMFKQQEMKKAGEFIEQINKVLIKMKGSDNILQKYKILIKNLNLKSARKYVCYNLSVQRLAEAIVKDKIVDTYSILVIHDSSKIILENDKNVSSLLIKNFRKSMLIDHKDCIRKMDKEIIKPLWRQWNKIFIDPFANVNYGNAHSVHKSQGSSFYNVFVDSDDILNNQNQEEAKRCIYTAFTRSSNELHILI